jgi:hypothetical protein
MDYKIQGPNSEQNNIPLRPNASDNANYTFNELNNYRQGSNTCQNKCIYCSMYLDNNNIDICKTCFKHRLIEELHRISLEYESINVLEVLEPNIEIQLRKNEQKKEYALSQILNIYNSNFINENLDKNRLIKEIKKETCVYCNGQINNEKYTLPCNCSLCSKKHLHKYINEKDLTKGPCNCCHYTNKMMFDLGVLLNSLNLQSVHKILNFLGDQLASVCCICGQNCVVFYTNSLACLTEHNENQKDHDDFLNKLEHRFCERCRSNLYNDSMIECKICLKIHILSDYNSIKYI